MPAIKMHSPSGYNITAPLAAVLNLPEMCSPSTWTNVAGKVVLLTASIFVPSGCRTAFDNSYIDQFLSDAHASGVLGIIAIVPYTLYDYFTYRNYGVTSTKSVPITHIGLPTYTDLVGIYVSNARAGNASIVNLVDDTPQPRRDVSRFHVRRTEFELCDFW